MQRRSQSKKPSQKLMPSPKKIRPSFESSTAYTAYVGKGKCPTPKHNVRTLERTVKQGNNNEIMRGRSNTQSVINVNKQNFSQTAKIVQPQQPHQPQKFIPGYNKIELLGKGGCASVWLCDSQKHSKNVAVKQIQQNFFQTAKREMKSAYLLADIEHPGMDFICSMLDIVEYKGEIYLVYELAGNSLGKTLFDIKGEFYKGQRVYKINYLPLYMELINNIQLIKELIRSIAKSLVVLSQKNLIHADLKPDNILIKCNNQQIESIKLIDFGNSFVLGKPKNLSSATPEYLPPEALISIMNGIQYQSDVPWSLDIWSLGAIFLEICCAFPLWLSLKARVGKNFLTGIFAAIGRENAKILLLQRQTVQDILAACKPYPGKLLSNDPQALDLLKGMLAWVPCERLSPDDVLKHPFLAS